MADKHKYYILAPYNIVIYQKKYLHICIWVQIIIIKNNNLNKINRQISK